MTREDANYYLKSSGFSDEQIETVAKAYAEPKTGHWIAHQEGQWIYAKCSECNSIHDVKTNYCPDCGRQMGGKP